MIKIGLDSSTLNLNKSNSCLNYIDYFNNHSFLELFASASIYREQESSKEPCRSRDLIRIEQLKPVSEQAEFEFSLVQGGSRFMTPEIQEKLNRISEICYSNNQYSTLTQRQRNDVRILESYVEEGIHYFITKNKRHFIDHNRSKMFENEFNIKTRLPEESTWSEINNQLRYYVVQVNTNASHDYASIHRSECSFSRPPEHSTGNTYWSQPYVSFDEALNFAQSKKNEVRRCSICKPSSL